MGCRASAPRVGTTEAEVLTAAPGAQAPPRRESLTRRLSQTLVHIAAVGLGVGTLVGATVGDAVGMGVGLFVLGTHAPLSAT